MDHFHGRRVLTLAICLWVAGVVGCAQQGVAKSWSLWPFGGKTSDVVPGIPSPAERTVRLKDIAKRASSFSPAEQEKIASELAAVYRQEDDPLIRAELLRTLTHFRTEAAGAVLRTGMSDSNVDVRIAACKAWGKRRDEEAVALLSRALGSDVDIDVRLAAAEALGETGQASAQVALGQALQDRDPAMQFRVVSSLRKVSDKDFGNDVNRWRQYAAGEMPAPEKPVSVAERFRRMF
jgi:HEAT repeat protein